MYDHDLVEDSVREERRDAARREAQASTRMLGLLLAGAMAVVGVGLMVWQVTRVDPTPLIVLAALVMTIPFLAAVMGANDE